MTQHCPLLFLSSVSASSGSLDAAAAAAASPLHLPLKSTMCLQCQTFFKNIYIHIYSKILFLFIFDVTFYLYNFKNG